MKNLLQQGVYNKYNKYYIIHVLHDVVLVVYLML